MGTVIYSVLVRQPVLPIAHNKITIGEMVSFLPLPGAWFALANRTLSPSIVTLLSSQVTTTRGSRVGGFIGIRKLAMLLLLIDRYTVAFPAKLVAVSSTMSFWVTKTTLTSALWITIAMAIPFTFNMLNVRKYGEIEFWLTTVKVATVVGIIILGILLPMGASTATLLLGTDDQHHPIPCSDPTLDRCVPQPGFNCITPKKEGKLMF